MYVSVFMLLIKDIYASSYDQWPVDESVEQKEWKINNPKDNPHNIWSDWQKKLLEKQRLQSEVDEYQLLQKRRNKKLNLFQLKSEQTGKREDYFSDSRRSDAAKEAAFAAKQPAANQAAAKQSAAANNQDAAKQLAASKLSDEFEGVPLSGQAGWKVQDEEDTEADESMDRSRRAGRGRTRTFSDIIFFWKKKEDPFAKKHVSPVKLFVSRYGLYVFIPAMMLCTLFHCLYCKLYCYDADLMGFDSMGKLYKRAGRKMMHSYMPGVRKDPETGRMFVDSQVTKAERTAAVALLKEVLDQLQVPIDIEDQSNFKYLNRIGLGTFAIGAGALGPDKKIDEVEYDDHFTLIPNMQDLAGMVPL